MKGLRLPRAELQRSERLRKASLRSGAGKHLRIRLAARDFVLLFALLPLYLPFCLCICPFAFVFALLFLSYLPMIGVRKNPTRGERHQMRVMWRWLTWAWWWSLIILMIVDHIEDPKSSVDTGFKWKRLWRWWGKAFSFVFVFVFDDSDPDLEECGRHKSCLCRIRELDPHHCRRDLQHFLKYFFNIVL